MASKQDSSRSESPAEIDFSVIRTAIQMNRSMLEQILHGVHYGSEETRTLLHDECDFILECRVCRNMFRSLPNFVAHKRVYCTDSHEDKRQGEWMAGRSNMETVIVQPEDPGTSHTRSSPSGQHASNTVVERVVGNMFDGKSSAYEMYTRAAEDLERQRVTKVTNTVTLTSIPTNRNAVMVENSQGDNAEEILRAYREKKQRERTKQMEIIKARREKKSIVNLCASLAKQKCNEPAAGLLVRPISKGILTRPRKSSPRKSVEYLTESEVKKLEDKNKTKLKPISNRNENGATELAATNADDKHSNKSKTVEKSPEKMETDQDSVEKTNDQQSTRLFSYSTGVKKCDKCDRVFWKAKTYSRHYSSCKKSIAKKDDKDKLSGASSQSSSSRSSSENSEISNKTPSPKKSPKKGSDVTTPTPELIVVGPKGKIIMRSRNTELLKLQEKLRAKAIWTSDSQGDKTDTAVVEQGNSKDKEPQKASTEKNKKLLEGLTKPLVKEVQDKEASPIKNSERPSRLRQDDDDDDDDGDEKVSDNEAMEYLDTNDGNCGSKNINEIRKLRERLSREAGLKDGKDMHKDESDLKTPIMASTGVHNVGLKRQSLEILELETKLTREALGKDTNDNSKKFLRSGEKQERAKSVEKVTNIGHNARKRNISQSESGSNIRTTEVGVKRHFRSISAGERTPEKLLIESEVLEMSPVSHRRSLPSSPTPSLQSNSGDGYNRKFKMTVKEMAELVESASLTKFAKDRKKRAKNFLTKKQSKDALSVSTLSKPMRRKAKPSVTKTDRPGSDYEAGQSEGSVDTSYSESTEERSKQPAKRLSLEQKRLQNSAGFVEEKYYKSGSGKHESLTEKLNRETEERKRLSKELKRLENSAGYVDKNVEAMQAHNFDASQPRDSEVKSELVGDSGKAKQMADHGSSSRESSHERPKSKLSREMKKLENSAGFVEDNFYISSRESSRDRQSDYSIDKTNMNKEPLPTSRDASVDRHRITDRCVESPKYPKELKLLQNSEGFVDKNVYAFPVYGDDQGVISSDCDADGGRKSREKVRSVFVSSKEGRFSCVRSSSGSSCESRDQKQGESRKLASGVRSSIDKPKIARPFIQSNKGDSPVRNTFEIKNSKSGNIISESSVDDKNDSKDEKHAGETDVKEIEIENEINELRDKNEDKTLENRHRTRLSTGSIFFDSELLKLSPSKLEKRSVWEVTKKSKQDKQKKEETSTVCKKLNLSPRKKPEMVKCKQAPASFGFYPLSTGLKQCPKCHERFWKKKSYDRHIKTKCYTAKQAMSGKKRTLSLSPKETLGSVDSRKAGNNSENVSKKRARIDISMVTTAAINENNDSVNENMKSEGNEMKSNKSNVTENAKKKSDKTIHYEEKEPSSPDSPIFTRSIEKSVSGIELSPIFQKKANKTTERFQGTERAKSGPGESTDVKVRNDKHDTKHTTKHCTMAAVDVEVTCSDKPDSDLAGEKSVRMDVMVVEEEPRPGPSSLRHVEDLASIAGTLSQSSEDDDSEVGSDFSGFSEDDLRVTEAELTSHLEAQGQRDEGDNSHIVDLEGDLSDLGVIDISSDLNHSDEETEVKVKPAANQKPEERSGRPVRKSAKERFSHFEEIWVYKKAGQSTEHVYTGQPPEPARAGNSPSFRREYVRDSENPTRLVCHSFVEIEKLVDETSMKCKQCDCPCTNLTNLRRHIISHLGWKRYKCKQCSFTCYDKSRIARHTENVHEEALTGRNFNKLVVDLKLAGNKIRSRKRTKSLRNTKKRTESGTDIYQKPKPVLNVKGSGFKSPTQKKTPKSVVCAKEKIDSDDKKSTMGVDTELVSRERNTDPLTKARMNLTKALKVD